MAERRGAFPAPPTPIPYQTIPGVGLPPLAASPPARTTNPFVELGVTGLRQFAGRIYDEWLQPELAFDRAPFVYRQMQDTEPIIGASLLLITMLLSRVPFTVNAADQSPAAEAEAAWLRGCLFEDLSRPFTEVIQEALSMLPHGWAALEIMLKKRAGKQDTREESSRFDDGLIGWSNFEIRAQETRWEWKFDAHGHAEALIQRDPVTGKLLPKMPRSKLLLFRTLSHKGSPEGRSLLRTAYEIWRLKRSLRVSLAIGLKRDLEGVPLMGVPPDVLSAMPGDETNYAMKQACDRLLRDFARDRLEGIQIPRDFDENGNELFSFTLLTSGGSNSRRNTNIAQIIDGLNLEIAITLLTDLFLLGHNAGGNRSLGDMKHELFAETMGAILDSMVEEFNRNAVTPLWEINAKDPRLQPTIGAGKVERLDLDQWGLFLLRLKQASIPVAAPGLQVLRWLGLGEGDLPAVTPGAETWDAIDEGVVEDVTQVTAL